MRVVFAETAQHIVTQSLTRTEEINGTEKKETHFFGDLSKLSLKRPVCEWHTPILRSAIPPQELFTSAVSP